MPIEILMPALSPTMTEGNLAAWLKNEGDKVEAGDIIAEIETDKATMEVEAVDEGILGRILVAAGSQNVPVNKLIALILEEGEGKKALDDYKVAEEAVAEEVQSESVAGDDNADKKLDNITAPTAAAVTQAPTATKAPSAPVKKPAGERIKVSPLAKRLANDNAINIAQISGTGPGGRIVKSDIENAVKNGGGSSVSRNSEEFVQIPHTTMRRVIARRLTESKQTVPHFYLTVDCNIDTLLEARKQLNGHAPKDINSDKPAYKISVNDMVIKAVALAMRDVPEANVSWYDDAMIQYNNVDVSVAVATEGGLITPIIRNSDQKSLIQISNEIKDLAARARKGELKPEEYEGGGFSISNLGMYGIKHFGAIVNPPQACILAVGAGEQQVIIKGGEMHAATVMSCTLSVDHRAVDGALGAEFLQVFKKYIEAPVTMLV